MDQDKKVSTSVSVKNPDFTSPFREYSNFIYIYKKTEKLASAVFMVTSLFSDNEPMKAILRKKVSDLLSFNLTYKDIEESNKIDFIYNLKTKILELVSFLEISLRGGLVSNMNFSILKQEFSNLSDLFDHSIVQKNSHTDILTKEFFSVDGGIKSYVLPESYGVNSQKSYSDDGKDKSEFKRSNRQSIILGLLKKKKELTIKDIAFVIKDCSEKTIQRELTSFIRVGVLKRTGERRWSKYSLA